MNRESSKQTLTKQQPEKSPDTSSFWKEYPALFRCVQGRYQLSPVRFGQSPEESSKGYQPLFQESSEGSPARKSINELS